MPGDFVSREGIAKDCGMRVCGPCSMSLFPLDNETLSSEDTMSHEVSMALVSSRSPPLDLPTFSKQLFKFLF